MRKVSGAALAVLLLGAAARADVVVLTDGAEVRGEVRRQGDFVVVRQPYGEARYRLDVVDSITTDAELKRAAEALEAAWRARREPLRRDASRDLPPEKALAWERDPAEAARLAAASGRLLMTFLVVGELGTGRC